MDSTRWRAVQFRKRLSTVAWRPSGEVTEIGCFATTLRGAESIERRQ